MASQPPELPPEREGGLFRFSVAHFLAALVLLLVTVPFVEHLPLGPLIEATLMTVVLLAAVPAIGGQRRAFIEGTCLVLPAVVSTWVNHIIPDLVPRIITLTAALVFVGFVVYRLLRFIMNAPEVDEQVLCAGIATYLMMGVFFSFAHTLVAQVEPDAYRFVVPTEPQPFMGRFKSLYFSFSTMTTVAYGDILPVSNRARLVSMIEATTGMFYVTLMIARLVALYTAASSDKPKEPVP